MNPNSSDPTVQPVPASVVEQVDAADVTLSNPKTAVISLGSNLGNRLETLQGAVDALEDTPACGSKPSPRSTRQSRGASSPAPSPRTSTRSR
ncbi:hypothetical protein ACFQVA_17600 [Actinomadura keratinilytica]